MRVKNIRDFNSALLGKYGEVEGRIRVNA
jgi:hypothetical protein